MIDALKQFYKTYVRNYIPVQRFVLFSGVKTPYDVRFGEGFFYSIFPERQRQDIPDYESGLVSGIHSHVKPGDKAIVVGGGLGITAALVALKVGKTGSVVCYEGNEDSIPLIQLTLKKNGVLNRVRLERAIVGPSIGVYGDNNATSVVDPKDLPECDVLELDCEGSEKVILREMTISPRVIIVETHGFLGSSSAEIEEILKSRGYEVKSLGPAEARVADFCIENDVMVLEAVAKDRAATSRKA